MFLYLWLPFLFVIGTCVGSFINVCVARLPLEKSILWPGSHCGQCYKPIALHHNLPLIGYLILRGQCANCKVRFSIQYFMVELLTGLGFVGLFYVVIIGNVHDWPLPANFRGSYIAEGFYPWQWLIGYGWHVLLFSFLTVCTFTDLNGREIPMSVTIPGTVIGLIGAMLLAWPWPLTEQQGMADIVKHQNKFTKATASWCLLPPEAKPKEGVYPWPPLGPPPSWAPPGSWQLGLLTGIAGALAGTFLVRLIGTLASKGLGKEAIGAGDADLMMMAGAFTGWQITLTSFFVGTLAALVVVPFQLFIRRDNSMPFGPSLAAGVLITLLCWDRILQAFPLNLIYFCFEVMAFLVIAGGGMLLLLTFLLRLAKGGKKAPKEDG
ncbi:MAG: prepilin peptidase [Gemmataceae bacterium]